MIRIAESSDLREVRRLAHDAFAPFVPRIGMPPAAMAQDFEAAQRAHQLFFFRERELKGYIICYPEDGVYRIDNLAVVPKFQRAGIGRQLLTFAEKRAFEAGCHKLAVYTNIMMTESIGFYERLGWREVDRRTDDGFERVFYEMSVD